MRAYMRPRLVANSAGARPTNRTNSRARESARNSSVSLAVRLSLLGALFPAHAKGNTRTSFPIRSDILRN